MHAEGKDINLQKYLSGVTGGTVHEVLFILLCVPRLP